MKKRIILNRIILSWLSYIVTFIVPIIYIMSTTNKIELDEGSKISTINITVALIIVVVIGLIAIRSLLHKINDMKPIYRYSIKYTTALLILLYFYKFILNIIKEAVDKGTADVKTNLVVIIITTIIGGILAIASELTKGNDYDNEKTKIR